MIIFQLDQQDKGGISRINIWDDSKGKLMVKASGSIKDNPSPEKSLAGATDPESM